MAPANDVEFPPSTTLTILGCGMWKTVHLELLSKADCPSRYPRFSHSLWLAGKLGGECLVKSTTAKWHSLQKGRAKRTYSLAPKPGFRKAYALHRLCSHDKFSGTAEERALSIPTTSSRHHSPRRKCPGGAVRRHHPAGLPTPGPRILSRCVLPRESPKRQAPHQHPRRRHNSTDRRNSSSSEPSSQSRNPHKDKRLCSLKPE